LSSSTDHVALQTADCNREATLQQILAN